MTLHAPVKKKILSRIDTIPFDLNRNLFERPEVQEHDEVTNFELLGIILMYTVCSFYSFTSGICLHTNVLKCVFRAFSH